MEQVVLRPTDLSLRHQIYVRVHDMCMQWELQGWDWNHYRSHATPEVYTWLHGSLLTAQPPKDVYKLLAFRQVHIMTFTCCLSLAGVHTEHEPLLKCSSHNMSML